MVSGSSPASSLFCAAVIASAHGIQGHVKVKCFLEDPAHLKTYSPYSNEEGEPVYTVKKVLSQNKDVLVVSFEGVTDRTKAESLRGSKLMLAPERLPELVDDTYYHKDLIGLSVISTEGQSAGTVHALYNFGAGELLEVKTIAGTLHMIPFTHEMVVEVDLEKGTLRLSKGAELFLEGGSDDT
ncbi:MAG: 16S rRNA processing protein RimM [Alphaproteobacteria bacterium]|nr:16S rRNA processing protein RimM [Alphaproteobacteria bacterium]